MRTRILCMSFVVAVFFSLLGLAQADYVTEVQADNPFAYYRLQELDAVHMTTAVNSGSTGISATYYQSGGTGGSFADVDSAVSGLTPAKQFNRDSDTSGASVGTVGQGIAYDSLTTLTIEAFLKPDNFEGLKRLILNSMSTWGAAGDLHINLNEGNLEFAMAGKSLLSVPYSSLASTDEWSHLAVTYETTEAEEGLIKFYFNGSLVNPGGNTNGTAGFLNFNQVGSIGAWYFNGSGYYDGSIDEVAFYDTALSAERIAAHYAAAFPPTDIPGDANRDGKVDGSDVTILAGNWQYGVDGSGSATWEMGDFNSDGKVDGSDVTILAGNWQSGVTSAAASVPEPGTIALILGMFLPLLIRRKQ